jgi:glycosyltransferase involved in cell wall biosynthesis
MRVLILSPFFFPEAISTGRYNTVLAKELVRRGAVVEVIASHPLYPTWRPERSTDQLPGMRIRRGGLWMAYPGRQFIRRILLETWYTAHVASILVWRRRRFDRVIVVFPPMLVARIARLLVPRRVPLTGIVHDLQGVMARNPIARKLARRLEGWSLSACDRLVFLSHSMAVHAGESYDIDLSKVAIRYPFLTLPAAAGSGKQLANELPDGFVHVVYSGALGEKQEPTKLLDFMLGLAQRNPDIRCHIFSAGPSFERLRACLEPGNSAVAFHGLVPDEMLGELYARSTVQIIPQATGTGDGALPSKLPNLLASGVPVFAICDGNSEAALLLRRAGESAGCSVASFNAPDTYVSFEELLRKSLQTQRTDRIAQQREFVAGTFGVAPLIAEILGD